MRSKQNHKIKAALLLFIFSMNTVIGFACALGFSFSTAHDHEMHGRTATHSHSATAAEEYEHSPSRSHAHDHNAHDASAKPVEQHSHAHEHPKGENSDECCSEKIIPQQLGDKAIAKDINVPALILVTSLYHSLINIQFSSANKTAHHFHQFVRWRPSTIPDIRIAIQSFQI